MEGDRKGALKGRQGTSFKKKGANKKGRWNNPRPEHIENTQVPNPTDTVYRILCPSKKIGSVIGKGGGIIKVLREETKSKITVSDSIPGSDERVIMIYSPPEKSSNKEADEGNEIMPSHCPAQEALMRVHDRIIEEDLSTGKEDVEDENCMVTARLLVPNNMVGCLIGKGGDVIQRLRSETGASIRVLPSEQLPSCALSTDELVQMQGKPSVLKRALYDVSTLLHQNPRKEKAFNYSLLSRGPGFQAAGPPLTNLPPPRGGDPMWSPRDPARHMPPPPWMEDFGRHPGHNPGAFDKDLTRPGVEPSGEYSLKILCPVSKIGGVIGKGGMNVRQLQQETGTSIHVEDASTQSEERVIRVSAFETLRNQRSQTIDAILMLQNKVSDVSEKGIITSRLLVPSNKVGCLLGQGGTVINEMRRRTQADIRVYSKDEKPECASEDEELVQVSGSFAVAKDALAEIASRLRARCLRDATVTAEPAPPRPRPVHGYGPTGGYPRGGPLGPDPAGMGSASSYNAVKGGMRDFEPPSYPVPPSASRYPNPNSSMESHRYSNPNSSMESHRYSNPNSSMESHRYSNPNSSMESHRYSNPNSSMESHYLNSGISSAPGAGGSFYAKTPEAPGMRMKLHDPYLGGSEPVADIRGASDRYPPAPANYTNYSGPNNTHQGSYPDPKGQSSYHSMAPQQTAYQNHHQIPYQQNNAQQSPYRNMNAQHSAYQSVPAHGSYQY
ncbi:KH domain-containing protein At4g18375-like [Chenopodium quinoa]|uniref:K Homology domain-containing protein n=1 Tax=Chenopodium quinoa TaxID=63459 RepID=A0A803LAV0_CHEQI|nr:KH domain-containing protein At4g18375-like [Chenopodium quinoa]